MFRVARGTVPAWRGLAFVVFALSFCAPQPARADDASTATPHRYGSVDRHAADDRGSGARDARDAGVYRERLLSVLEQLPEADREHARRRLRAMSPAERRRFFVGFQGLSPEGRRERFIGWLAQGRRDAVLEQRQGKLRDLRGNLDGLSRREKRALHRQVQQMTPEQQFALRERMKNLEPGEQRELARRIGRWRRLDEDEQQEVRDKLDRYRDRPYHEQETVRRNTERWRTKPPDERRALREKWEHWQSLTPVERDAVRRGLEDEGR